MTYSELKDLKELMASMEQPCLIEPIRESVLTKYGVTLCCRVNPTKSMTISHKVFKNTYKSHMRLIRMNFILRETCKVNYLGEVRALSDGKIENMFKIYSEHDTTSVIVTRRDMKALYNTLTL